MPVQGMSGLTWAPLPFPFAGGRVVVGSTWPRATEGQRPRVLPTVRPSRMQRQRPLQPQVGGGVQAPSH